MDPNSDRWHEVSRSEFAHEREGLVHVRELLPDRGPFHAWSNFEFRDGQGRWAEVDLLVLGEGRLHLVELKHYRGALDGNAYRWQRGSRSEDSPLIGARRKAQRIKSVLSDAARELGLPTNRVPFVQESVFLHAADHRCLLAAADRVDLFGLDGVTANSNLPSIAERLLEPDRGRNDRPRLTEDELLRVVDRAGFAVRRERTVGSWRLVSAPSAEGPGWQDWPAEHKVDRTEQARIRFFTVSAGASQAEVASRLSLVAREWRLTQRLRHDGVLSPRDLVDHELGPGLVFPHDPADQRLDLWLADHGRDLSLARQVALVRQVAEAVQYAHAHGVVHRGLNPTAIQVRSPASGAAAGNAEPRARVGGWEAAGVAQGATAWSQALATDGRFTRIHGVLDERDRQARPDRDERLAEVYVAPEGRWSHDAHRVRLDVFALGALAYVVLTGQPPATSALDLKERLRRDGGLDLAADLPEASTELRAVVREATSPRVSERLRDVSVFLERLSEVERTLAAAGEPGVDPLDAPPGTLLGDRFELVRRLGQGSTAVGLLVRDQQADESGDRALRVLKVALDDAAARRLHVEAEVLRGLGSGRHPRVVRLLEPEPVHVGQRTALVLESAGEETLADILRERHRLSLDLLERWGVDLLEALVSLDAAGVDHRDVKPSNLGIREQRSDRAKHLVLYDFSLARATAAATEAGTPPYLDPFLGQGTRTHWDSAAERYAAAVTLFEMATGRTPVHGDGASDPAVIDDEPTVVGADFDPAVADAMVEFFSRALARDAQARIGTAAEMLAAWRSALSATVTASDDDVEALVERATLDTPLPQSGLTSRALSALEPFRLETVADLAGLDTGTLSRFTGIVDVTKREIRRLAKLWREKYADELAASDDLPDGPPDVEWSDDADPLADPRLTATQLMTFAEGRRARGRSAAAAVLLGLEGDAPAFATLDDLAGRLGLDSSTAVASVLGDLRSTWSGHLHAMQLLDQVADRAIDVLEGLGGAAWADVVATTLVADGVSDADRRVVAGLLRAALDRLDDRARTRDEDPAIVRRRRRTDNRLLLATGDGVAAAARRLGPEADRLVAEAVGGGEHVVTRGRAVPTLREIWSADLPPLDDLGLVRLAARLADTAAGTPGGELYAVAMPAVDAVRHAFGATTPGQAFDVADVRRLVRVRFPAVAELPGRPELDDVVRNAGTGLYWVDGRYAVPSAHSETTFATRTAIPMLRPSAAGEHPLLGELADSVRAASYLALGVRDREAAAVTVSLLERFGGVEVNVTDLLLDGLRARAAAANVPWEKVAAADAAEPDSRDAQGLAALVQQVVPEIEAALTAAVAAAAEASRPVLLTEAAPLARYGHVGLLARLSEMGARRANAVWLIVPQGHDLGPHLDGTPIPRAYASQWVSVESGAVPVT